MLDPSILRARPQQPDTSIGDLVDSLRQGRMDRQRAELVAVQRARQLAAQRVSENQLTQQQAAQQRAEQVRQAVADPNATFDTIRKTGDLDTAEKFRASRQQITEAQRKEAADENEFIARGIGAILETPDDNKRGEAYSALFDYARQRFGDEAIGKLGLTPQYSRALDSRLDMFRRTALTQLQQLEAAKTQQETVNSRNTEQRTATLFPDVQRKTAADADLAGLTAAGQAPIQPADKARIDREALVTEETKRHNQRMESLSAQANSIRSQEAGISKEKMSGEAAKVLGVASTILPELDKLEALFRDSYKTTVAGNVTGTNREVVRLIDNIADKVGRLRSGGAINKAEEKRFLRQLGAVPADLAFGTPEQAIEALRGVRAEAQLVASKMSPSTVKPTAAKPAITEADIAETVSKSGKTRDEVIKAFKANGYQVR